MHASGPCVTQGLSHQCLRQGDYRFRTPFERPAGESLFTPLALGAARRPGVRPLTLPSRHDRFVRRGEEYKRARTGRMRDLHIKHLKKLTLVRPVTIVGRVGGKSWGGEIAR